MGMGMDGEPPCRTRRGWVEDRKVQQSCLKPGGETGGIKQRGVGLWMVGASETFKVYQRLKSFPLKFLLGRAWGGNNSS